MYRASPSLVAKNIINLILGIDHPVMSICVELSLVSHDQQVDSLPLVPPGKPPLRYVIGLIESYKKVDDPISFLQFKFEFYNKDFMI